VKVTDSGWNPAGTGPPGGPASVVVVDGAGVVVTVVVEDALVVVVDDTARGARWPDEHAASPTATRIRTDLRIGGTPGL